MNKNNIANERESLLIKFISNTLIIDKLDNHFFNCCDSEDEGTFWIYHDLSNSLREENAKLLKTIFNDALLCSELHYRCFNYVVEKLKGGHLKLSPGCTSFTQKELIEWDKTYRKTTIESLFDKLLREEKEKTKEKGNDKKRKIFKVIK